MDITVPQGTNIIVLEGVPGAGKTTLHNQLKELIADRLVYDYHEEYLLFSWMHAWIPGIEELRLSLIERMLEYVEVTLAENPKAIFVFNRFHITYWLFNSYKLQEVDRSRFEAVLEKLRRIGTHVYVPLVSEEEIEARASHKERQDPLWNIHLAKRLASQGYDNLAGMYSNEQKKIRKLLEEQNIPYSILAVAPPSHGNY